MMAPPLNTIYEDDAEGSRAVPGRTFRGKTLSRVVSITSGNSPANPDATTAREDAVPMLSDDGSARRRDVSPPIVQSGNPASADGARIVPAKKDGPKPGKVGSLGHSAPRCNVKIKAGSTTLQKNRGRPPAFKKGSAKIISGRWTPAEHEAFLQGLKVHGREWKKVATCVPTRSAAQIRSHAQKYFAKVSREQQQFLAMAEQHHSAFAHGLSPKSDAFLMHGDQPKSRYFIDTVNSIVENPPSAEGRVRQKLASLRERYKQLQIRHQQNHVPAQTPVAPPVKSEETAAMVGPVTAALEKEQQSLRNAALARHELKSRENQLQKRRRTIRTEISPWIVKLDEGDEPSPGAASAAPSPGVASAPPNLPGSGPPSDARLCRHASDGVTSCARVSLSSMPSHHGGFDSSDVLALSVLGGSLCKRKMENKTIATN